MDLCNNVCHKLLSYSYIHKQMIADIKKNKNELPPFTQRMAHNFGVKCALLQIHTMFNNYTCINNIEEYSFKEMLLVKCLSITESNERPSRNI